MSVEVQQATLCHSGNTLSVTVRNPPLFRVIMNIIYINNLWKSMLKGINRVTNVASSINILLNDKIEEQLLISTPINIGNDFTSFNVSILPHLR